MWEVLTYQQRKFFDWGGWLAVRPLDELPHWWMVMRRERDHNSRLHSALALYYLWLTGEVMTHHRENFERVYALTETVAPAQLMRESDEGEADRFLIKKDVSFSGLLRMNRVSDSFHRGVPFGSAGQIIEAMLADGELIAVQVEGWKAMHYALGSDASNLDDLSTGHVPQAWTPLATTTTEEARLVRDVGLAEDLAQDALVIALRQWPAAGIPNKPSGLADEHGQTPGHRPHPP